MNRRSLSALLLTSLLSGPLVWTGCSTADGKTNDAGTTPAAAVPVTPAAAVERAMTRFIRATGSLTAEEQADVAAETRARVISTPIERGTVVSQGSELVRLSATEAEA